MTQPPVTGRPEPGPPLDCMPAVIPIGSVFGRSAQAVVGLAEIHVYGGGCLFHFVAAAARPDPPTAPWGDPDQGARIFAHVNGHTDELLTLSLEGPDGITASVLASTPAPISLPEGPVWANFEGRGQADRAATRLIYRQPVWLSPLPSFGTLRLRASWPAYGIEAAALTVKASTLARAATNAQPFWPDR